MDAVRAPLGAMRANVAPSPKTKEDFLPSIYARLYMCSGHCAHNTRFVRRAGAVYCFECSSVAERAESIDNSPPKTDNRPANDFAKSNGPTEFASPSLTLSASMGPLASSRLPPQEDEDDEDEDEVCIAPRHRVSEREKAAVDPSSSAFALTFQQQKKITELERELGQAKEVNTHLQKSLDEVGSKNVEATSTLASLKTQKAEVERALEQERSTHERLQAYCKNLEEDRESILSKASKRNAELQGKNEELEAQLSKGSTALEEQLSDARAEMAVELSALQGELSEAVTKSEDLLAEITEMRTAAVAEANTRAGEKRVAEEEVAAANSKLGEAQDRCIELESQVSALEASRGDAELEAKHQVEQLGEQVVELTSKLEAASAEKGELQEALTEAHKMKTVSESLVSENADLVVSVKSITKQAEEAAAQTAAVQAEADKAQAGFEAKLLEATEAVQLQLMEAQKSATDKHTQLQQHKAASEAMQDRVTEAEQQCAAKDAQIQQLQEELAGASAEAGAAADAAALEAKVQEVTAAMEQQAQDYEDQYAAVSAELAAAHETLAAAKIAKETLSQELEHTKVALEQSQPGDQAGRIAELEGQLRVQERNKEMEATGRQLEANNHLLEVKNLKLQIEDLQGQLARGGQMHLISSPARFVGATHQIQQMMPMQPMQQPVQQQQQPVQQPVQQQPVQQQPVQQPVQQQPVQQQQPVEQPAHEQQPAASVEPIQVLQAPEPEAPVEALPVDPMQPREAPAHLNPREKMLWRKQEKQRIEDETRKHALAQAMEAQQDARQRAASKTRGEFHQ